MAKERQRLKLKTATHQSFYREYKKIAGKDALDYKTFDAIVKAFFWRLSREIITDKYEWKLPFGGGYLRIAQSTWGKFYHKWDVINPYTRLKRKRIWSFKPVVDWTHKMIGERGLRAWVLECDNDPMKAKYSVSRIRHFIGKVKDDLI